MKRASTGCPASSAEHQDVENLSNSDEESNPATQAATLTDGPTRTTKTKSKKAKYEEKFQNSWLSDNQFKDWLEKRAEFPYCKLCDCKLSCAKTALKQHIKNKKHQEISQLKQQSIGTLSMLLGSREKAARMEIKLCSFIVEKIFIDLFCGKHHYYSICQSFQSPRP